MIIVRIKERDVEIDDEHLKSMEVKRDNRRGRGQRLWSLLFHYENSTEELSIFDDWFDSGGAMYMVSVMLDQKKRGTI